VNSLLVTAEARVGRATWTTHPKIQNAREKGRAMPRYIGIALTNPVDGRKQEFDEFYDNQHIPDVLALTGVHFRSEI
jgi:hypothetical protein